MKQDIRIGTLVSGGAQAPSYIQQIQEHGFESYALTFGKNVGDCDLIKLADELMPVLEKTGAVISSVGIYGNPLETDEGDLKIHAGWEQLIDSAHLFHTDIVSGFTGRVRGKAIHESIPRFAGVFQ